MLSAAPEVNVNSLGCRARARMLFLWLVRVQLHFPAARSHSLIVLSCEPEITCGSDACVMIDATVLVCPDKQWT